MKNTLEGIYSWITEVEEQIKWHGRQNGENHCHGKEKIRIKRSEYRLRDLWDNIKCTNIHIIGVPEGEERNKRPEKIFEELIAENFPKAWERK